MTATQTNCNLTFLLKREQNAMLITFTQAIYKESLYVLQGFFIKFKKIPMHLKLKQHCTVVQ